MERERRKAIRAAKQRLKDAKLRARNPQVVRRFRNNNYPFLYR